MVYVTRLNPVSRYERWVFCFLMRRVYRLVNAVDMGANADLRFRCRAATGWLSGQKTAKYKAKNRVMLSLYETCTIRA